MNTCKITHILKLNECTWWGSTASGKVAQVEKKAEQFHFTCNSCVEILTIHEQVKVTYHLRINECTWSGCTGSGKKSRPLWFHKSLSCFGVLIMNEPVKSNLPPENKWMHMVRMYHKWKREQTTLISQIVLVSWSILTMNEHVKCNLHSENKWTHMVRKYHRWKREQTTIISQIILLCSNAIHAWTSER